MEIAVANHHPMELPGELSPGRLPLSPARTRGFFSAKSPTKPTARFNAHSVACQIPEPLSLTLRAGLGRGKPCATRTYLHWKPNKWSQLTPKKSPAEAGRSVGQPLAQSGGGPPRRPDNAGRERCVPIAFAGTHGSRNSGDSAQPVADRRAIDAIRPRHLRLGFAAR
jgi:hypothetical protein